jgi:hypothetical protein
LIGTFFSVLMSKRASTLGNKNGRPHASGLWRWQATAFRGPSPLLDCLFELSTAVEDVGISRKPLDFGLAHLTSHAEAESTRRDADHG